jgi:hypothetical protein
MGKRGDARGRTVKDVVLLNEASRSQLHQRREPREGDSGEEVGRQRRVLLLINLKLLAILSDSLSLSLAQPDPALLAEANKLRAETFESERDATKNEVSDAARPDGPSVAADLGAVGEDVKEDEGPKARKGERDEEGPEDENEVGRAAGSSVGEVSQGKEKEGREEKEERVERVNGDERGGRRGRAGGRRKSKNGQECEDKMDGGRDGGENKESLRSHEQARQGPEGRPRISKPVR